MSKFRIEKVNQLPNVISPSTMYIVKSLPEGFIEIYVSNNLGNELTHVINRTEILALITSSINGINSISVKETIEERDAAVINSMSLVLVKNATGDPTVNSGAALYFYDPVTGSYTKVSEYESMDFSLDWNSLLNKPTSIVANIDDAVLKRHQHANHSLLDELSKDGNGNLLVNGNHIGVYVKTSEW